MGGFKFRRASLGPLELVMLKTQNVAKGNIGIPEDGRVDNCVPWTRVTGPEHPRLSPSTSGAWSQARINLPIEADALYLTARGALASGDVYVRESHEAEDMSVTVFVSHRGKRALSHATVCRLSRDGGEMGVGIFVRSSYLLYHFLGIDLSSRRLHFHILCPGTHEAATCDSSLKSNFPPVVVQFGIYRLSMRTYPGSPWPWVTYRVSALVTLL